MPSVGRPPTHGKEAEAALPVGGGVMTMQRTVLELATWRLRARVEEGHACGLADAGLFFGDEEETDEQRRRREAAAVRVCAGCPVAAECRELAVRNRERFGVWGGLGEAQLHRVIRARSRGTAA